MYSLTVAQARKILGKDAEGVSDTDLEKDIEVARLFKDIFFSKEIKRPSRPSTASPNVP